MRKVHDGNETRKVRDKIGMRQVRDGIEMRKVRGGIETKKVREVLNDLNDERQKRRNIRDLDEKTRNQDDQEAG